MSNYQNIVNIIINQLKKKHDTLNDSTVTNIYGEIAYQFSNVLINTGSSRLTIAFPDEGFVIKLPLNDSGIKQNLVEYSQRDDDSTTTIFKSYALFNVPHFILVSEYADSILDYANEFICDLAKIKPSTIDWKSYLQDYDSTNTIKVMLSHTYEQCLDSFEIYNNDYFDLLSNDIEESNQFSDIFLLYCDDYFSFHIIDRTIDNIGVINDKLVQLDSGIDEYDDVFELDSDYRLTV